MISHTMRVMLNAIWGELVKLRGLEYLATRIGAQIDGTETEPLAYLLNECATIATAIESYTASVNSIRATNDNEAARRLIAAVAGAKTVENLRLARQLERAWRDTEEN